MQDKRDSFFFRWLWRARAQSESGRAAEGGKRPAGGPAAPGKTLKVGTPPTPFEPIHRARNEPHHAEPRAVVRRRRSSSPGHFVARPRPTPGRAGCPARERGRHAGAGTAGADPSSVLSTETRSLSHTHSPSLVVVSRIPTTYACPLHCFPTPSRTQRKRVRKRELPTHPKKIHQQPFCLTHSDRRARALPRLPPTSSRPCGH